MRKDIMVKDIDLWELQNRIQFYEGIKKRTPNNLRMSTKTLELIKHKLAYDNSKTAIKAKSATLFGISIKIDEKVPYSSVKMSDEF